MRRYFVERCISKGGDKSRRPFNEQRVEIGEVLNYHCLNIDRRGCCTGCGRCHEIECRGTRSTALCWARKVFIDAKLLSGGIVNRSGWNERIWLAASRIDWHHGVVNIASGLFCRCAFDNLAAHLQVIGGNSLDCLLNSLLVKPGIAAIKETQQMVAHTNAERFFAHHHGKTTSKTLRHLMSGGSDAGLVGFVGKVLGNQLPSRNTSHRATPFYRVLNNFPNGAVNG
mmetsp:Transcript_54359/g.133233  ORF Transcript_54359/g.133233 Transcript_54359/m.133233 type:complete len:227 (-) Transcript_54359:46-726(-)